MNYVIVRFVWSFLGKEAEQKMSILFAEFLLCAGYNMYISSFNFHKALWHTYNHCEHHHPYVIDIDTLRLNNMTLVPQCISSEPNANPDSLTQLPCPLLPRVRVSITRITLFLWVPWPSNHMAGKKGAKDVKDMLGSCLCPP